MRYALGKSYSVIMSDDNPLSLTEYKNPLHNDKKKDPVFVKYQVDQSAPGANPKMHHRVVKIVEEQTDPLEPSRFRHKKAPRSPGSPPPAVMHSPQRKLTEEDQKNWKIPPCVSLWKNEKGYTIPLDKRIAGDGRYQKGFDVSDKFASFSETLFAAADLAREEVKLRNDIRLHQKALEAKQQEDELLSKAREIRKQREAADDATRAMKAMPGETFAEAAARMQRLELERARKKEIEREFRMESNTKKYKRAKTEGDRDISERIALGLAQATSIGRGGSDGLFDSRLFDKSGGLDSGFQGGDDEVQNIYEKSLWDQMKESRTGKF